MTAPWSSDDHLLSMLSAMKCAEQDREIPSRGMDLNWRKNISFILVSSTTTAYLAMNRVRATESPAALHVQYAAT